MVKLSFRQQVITGFSASILLVFIIGLLSYNSIKNLEVDAKWVDHTQQVIKNSNNLLQLMIDAETGVRGYGATNNKVFLEPYNTALPNIAIKIDSLKKLTDDNPTQQKRIDSLSLLVEKQLNILKTDIETREAKGLDYMVQNHMFLNGKNNMDSIRYLRERINNEENVLLVARKQSSIKQSTTTTLIILTGSTIFLLIILVLFFYIQQTFDKQKVIEANILSANSQLEEVLAENEAKNWLLTGTGTLSEMVQGEQSEKQLAEKIITEACQFTGAQTGTFYVFNEAENWLEFVAGYAFHNLDVIKKHIKLSEGWIGQTAKDGKIQLIKGKLNSRLGLESSLLSNDIAETLIVPFFFDKKLKGVVELAFTNGLSKGDEDYLRTIANIMGVSINTAQARTIMHDLFEEVQQQAEELEAQQEELRTTNEELIKKTEMLQASEEELRVQQEELRTTNTELEEKASLLEEKNQAIEEARRSIGQKMRELEATGKYKSEFLANMSHELRTPLNSILVLARILKDNKAQTLTDDQIKYATVIFNAGNDLLTLINDILDLSKIESGKLELVNEQVKIAAILKDSEALFAEVAKNKNIIFTTRLEAGVPEYILTDMVRTQQVVKNLLSNAFKFTSENGSVSVIADLDETRKNLSLTIKDTGIGIPYDKQKLIFEAFQQADGSTSRKYGGTGLGLSISRELAHLLGGVIKLKSTPGEGSEFSLILPLEGILASTQHEADEVPTVKSWIEGNDDATPFAFDKPLQLDTKKSGRTEPLVVIVEDDKNFASILQDYAKQHGYKSILVHDGDSAVATVKTNQPDAVILDIMLPGKDGWQILKELKKDPETTNIPVHLMSAGDAAVNRVRQEGAISFLKKPINIEVLDKLFKDMAFKSGSNFKRILLIEDHKMQSQALKDLMEKQGITVDQAFDGETAFNLLLNNEYQCVILDINLPDISGLDLLDKIKEVERFSSLPVIVNTAMELDKTSVSRLMQYANAMVVKNNKSSERLIDEVNLFLNKINSTAGKTYPAAVETAKIKSYAGDKSMLKNKKILIVDDDMRNIFALSSALQTYDMQVEIANDGEESLTKLEELKGIDMVLMDIMMPKMDGYEAMRRIRQQPKWAKLPVIALTAKAMKEDREKCIEAGANDYITKPVDIDRLLALMQLWLEQ